MCKLGRVISLLTVINWSIIQELWLDPLLHSIMKDTYIKFRSQKLLFKYADYTNLIVPETINVCLLEEFDHKGVGKN